MAKRKRGSITVEATITLPIYILFIAFIINFLNIFYMQLVVQGGLNNAASIFSQYCYAVDVTLGIKNLGISETTSAKGAAISGSIAEFQGATENAISAFGQPISLERLPILIDSGKRFVSATSVLKTSLGAVEGEDVVNLLFSAGAEFGGEMLLDAMMKNYLTEMGVNQNFLKDGVHYSMMVDTKDGRYDLILTARYAYEEPMLSVFFDTIPMKQTVVVHPWIGGATDGLKEAQNR